jgi:hypothetical protein
MTQVGLQFHADGPEAVAMVAGWAGEFALSAALGRLFGGRPVEVGAGGFGVALQALQRPDYVLLNRRPLRLGGEPDLARLAVANPGSLILQLGRHTGEGVRESALGAGSEDPEDVALWRRLVGRARRCMRRGAVVTNPMTGASASLPSHRFTEDALRLQAGGSTMLAIAGWNTYRLLPDARPDPSPDRGPDPRPDRGPDPRPDRGPGGASGGPG